jgi:hypothetical protein
MILPALNYRFYNRTPTGQTRREASLRRKALNATVQF